MSSVFAVKKRRVNPATLLYSAKPKIGKTTKLSELKNNLIINLEKNGADFLKGVDIIDASQILTASVEDIKALLLTDIRTKVLDIADIVEPNERHKALNRILNALIKLGRPYDYVSIDTITQADIDAEWAGTELYMDSLQGKTFNRENIVGQPSTKWPRLKYGDPNYQSVIEIGQNGWRWSRTIMVDLLGLSRQAAKKCTIYVCHIKDKMLSKGDKGEVFIKDIALTGAVADIYSRNVDAIASVYKDEENLVISFKGNEDRTGGNRGDIGSYEGDFDWDKLFVEES
jgi:hypothetical protein